ncbi:MAG: hypothetical protein O3A01_06270 [bacterium]|nr:hypothetical protein [bacterium]
MVNSTTSVFPETSIVFIHPKSLSGFQKQLASFDDWVLVGDGDVVALSGCLDGLARYYYARELGAVALESRQEFLNDSAVISSLNSGLSWWTSSVSYRCPLSVGMFEQYCLFRLLERWRKPKAVSRLVVSGDLEVLRLAKYRGYRVVMPRFLMGKNTLIVMAKRLKFWAGFCAKMIGLYGYKIMALIGYGASLGQRIANARYGICVMSWIDSARVKEGKINDVYLQHIYPTLERISSSYIVMGLSLQKWGDMRAISQSDRGVPMGLFLSFWHVISVAIQGFLLMFRDGFKYPSDGRYALVSDIHRITSATWRMSGLSARLHFYVAQRMMACVLPAQIWYPFENQPHEKAIVLARGKRAIKIVGIQHASLPINYINIGIGVAETDCMPLPDLILVNSSLWKRRLLELLPCVTVEVLGMVRGNGINLTQNDGVKSDSVLVVLPYAKFHAIALIRFCLTLSKVTIVLRPHPDFSESTFRSWVPEIPQSVRFDTRPMADVLAHYSVCIHSGTTAAIECMAAGMQVIKYMPERLDLDPLLGVFDALPSLADGDQLDIKASHSNSSDIQLMIDTLFTPLDEGVLEQVVSA